MTCSTDDPPTCPVEYAGEVAKQCIKKSDRAKFMGTRQLSKDVSPYPCTCHEAGKEGGGRRHHDVRCAMVKWCLGDLREAPDSDDLVQYLPTAALHLRSKWRRYKLDKASFTQRMAGTSPGGRSKKKAKTVLKGTWTNAFEM